MNKSDLIEKIVESGNLPRKRAEQVVNLVFDEMTAALARDERIEIRGFGSFVSKHYRARTGRNPRTGESIPVPAKRLPIFKVGKELRERVDSSGSGDGAKIQGSQVEGGGVDDDDEDDDLDADTEE